MEDSGRRWAVGSRARQFRRRHDGAGTLLEPGRREEDWTGAHLVTRAPIGDMAAPLWAGAVEWLMAHGRVGVVVGCRCSFFWPWPWPWRRGAEPRVHSFVAISLLSPSSVSFGRRHWLRLNYDLPAHPAAQRWGVDLQVSVPHTRQARFIRRLHELLRSDGQRANANIPEGPAIGREA